MKRTQREKLQEELNDIVENLEALESELADIEEEIEQLDERAAEISALLNDDESEEN